MAASICKKNNCTPREVYSNYLGKLLDSMRRGAGKIQTFAADEHGVIELPSNAATLRGKQLRYESERDSLGFWRNVDDFAVWQFKIDQVGSYQLQIQYACQLNEAGGKFEVRLGDGSDHWIAAVESTGKWDRYERKTLATIDLELGTYRISVHSKKEVGPLMKLRSLRIRSTK